MREKLLFKEFIKYSTLNILGMVSVSLYVLADTYFIANGLGNAGLSALNIVLPTFNIIFAFSMMISIGASTKFAYYKNIGEEKKANSYYTTAVKINLILSAIFFIMGLFFPKQISYLLGANQETVHLTEVYLRVLLIGTAAFVFNNLFQAFIRNDNAPKNVMFAMITGSLSNIVLDYLFIFPLNMGMFGAILATVMSPIISICIMFPHFIKKKNTFHFIESKVDFIELKEIFITGLPVFVSELAVGIVMMTFNYQFLSIEGNIAVGAYGVIANVAIVVFAIYNGLAQGVQPLYTRYFAKRSKKRMIQLIKYSFLYTLIISVVMYISVLVFSENIINAFNSENNLRLSEIAFYGLRVYFIGALFTGFNTLLSIFFISINKTKIANSISLLKGLIIILPAIIIIGKTFGLSGIWFAFPIAEAITLIYCIYHYLKIKRAHYVV